MNLNTLKTRFGVVGHAPKLTSALEIAVQVAPTEVTVLVNGENGTGKEVFSKIIHQFSRRKHEKFLAINCGAIPDGTIDSELFGHEKGSFTSAYESRKGYFEEVNGGTIFLDEIGEMPLPTQSRLLRVLESGEFIRVGSNKILKTDVRIVAATNKNLIDMIRMGRFREDLYFRLNTVSISVPPLRERGDDIEMLFLYFLNEFAEKYNRSPLNPNPSASDLLYEYRWPGNVRELRNFAEKLTVLIQSETITAEQVTDHLMITESYLPSIVQNPRGYHEPVAAETSRDIDMLYKLIAEIKTEMGEMKKLFYMGMQQGVAPQPTEKPRIIYDDEHEISQPTPNYPSQRYYSTPRHEVQEAPRMLEESLSLEKKEKEMIQKALNKYQNNRKKAATELGISERTLYRKIKQFNLG